MSSIRRVRDAGVNEDALARGRDRTTTILVAVTIMLAGRAMTLAYLGRVGGGESGDPPLAWTLPLVGDAIIGVAALPVAYLLWQRPSPTTALVALVWNALAIWDALGAFVVSRTTPWPEFFMVRAFGASMFFAASAMHALCIYLLFRPESRSRLWAPARDAST